MKRLQRFIREIIDVVKNFRDARHVKELLDESDRRIRVKGDESGSYIVVDNIRIARLVSVETGEDDGIPSVTPETSQAWISEIKRQFVNDKD